jgi:HK97 family phage portal protein
MAEVPDRRYARNPEKPEHHLMNRVERWFLKKALEIFTPLTQGNTWSNNGLLPRTKIDYAREVGDGLGSSVLMSPIKWIQRTFPEARLEVVRLGENSDDQAIVGHEIPNLVRRPNPFYTGTALWAGTIFSTIVSGDGYWLKIRKNRGQTPWYQNVVGEIEEFWYAPHWILEPQWPSDGSVFISHYRYSPGGQTVDVAPENVIHFRNGLDPRNTRHGLSMIASELREIFSDDEAANFVASLLRNMGIPGVIVSPEAGMIASDDDVKAVKAHFKQLKGDSRGEPLVLGAPTKVEQFGFDPKQMDVSMARDTAEERICAALGLPAAIVGYGSGMDQTKVGATMQVLKQMAWQACLIPLQDQYAEQLNVSLLPEFESNPEQFEVRFNRSKVGALQENQTEKARAIDIGVKGGWMRVDLAQQKMGFDVDASQALYLRSTTTVEVPVGSIREPVPPATAAAAKSQFKARADRRFLRVQSRLEQAAIADIEALFAKESKSVVKQFESVNAKAQTKDWLDDTTAGTRTEWEALMFDLMTKAIQAGWALTEFEIDSAVAFDIFQPAALDFAKTQSALKIKGIQATTIESVREILSKAVENGLSITDTAKALRKAYSDFSPLRAEIIARTETSSAMNYGKHHAALETQARTGLQLERTWSAVNDNRTRETHRAADGEVRRMDETFLVGGAQLKFPGDPDGPPQEIINCRCTQIFSEIQDTVLA